MTLTRTSIAGLVVAVGAGAALLLLGPDREPPAPPARAALADAWPRAHRADLPGNLADGPIFQPGLFLDARTAIGTAPSPDGRSLRLVMRGAEGEVRELRRRPLSEAPVFDHFAVAGDRLAWTESAGRRTEIWAAGTGGGAPRRLTADTGDALFYGTPYDLVIAGRRVHWVAAAGAEATEIRSVALTGGEVRVRTEPGVWSLTTWPWLTSGAADQAGTTVLRDLTANREQRVPATGAELASCTPAWCRVVVSGADGPARIDVMRPDGGERRRIAGGGATAAINDVAVLDRFEVLSEARPDSDLTGEEGLLVYDIGTGRTVDLTATATAAGAGNGVVWWSTGDQDSLVWHTVDLRTV
jgi:hypothetical protein